MLARFHGKGSAMSTQSRSQIWASQYVEEEEEWNGCHRNHMLDVGPISHNKESVPAVGVPHLLLKERVVRAAISRISNTLKRHQISVFRIYRERKCCQSAPQKLQNKESNGCGGKIGQAVLRALRNGH
ncbi:hypothetical protein V6N13_144704 [Hibiscus sabdariffa]|uniref:Uncharacterized protein n=1 Tax=Hibiscus sabdariffa TaxID=183260 RepID=A0ABR2FLK0_9ROSI